MESYRVYHGTGARFSTFQCPAYFTDSLETAEFFADRNASAGTPTVLTCELLFENPLVVDLSGQSWGGFFLSDGQLQKRVVEFAACGDEDEQEYFMEEGITVPFLASYAETLGYDGLVAYNCMEEDGRCSLQAVVFYPDCVLIK